MSCYRFENVRYIRNRHHEQCEQPCSGCLTCPNRHCTCGHHLTEGDYACPQCVGYVRTHLQQIEDRAALMLPEAVIKGVRSEAAMLAGPATDPEAWAWRRAAQARRENVPLSTLPEQDSHHPRSVLGEWERAFREDYNQATNLEWTITRSVDYLTGILTRLARDDQQDFPQFAKEIKSCLNHLEIVLHDQPYGDPAGVDCFECGGNLERRLVATGFEDLWTCDNCHRRYTYAEYNFALRAKLESSIA
jgi:hypothetical protein